MICECTIPKALDDLEECRNKAQYSVVLIEEFGNEHCFWCEVCCTLGTGMIKSKENLFKGIIKKAIKQVVEPEQEGGE